MAKIWVTIPTYNEVENLPIVLERTLAQPLDLAVVIVDGASPDGTGDLAEQYHTQYPQRVHVIHQPTKGGRGSASFAGFEYCLAQGAEWIIEMDADLSHDPNALVQLVQTGIDHDCGLVVGSRYIPGGYDEDRGPKRRLISWGANRYLRIVLGLGLRDCSSGFRCYRRDVMEALDLSALHSVGPESGPEIMYRIKEMGYCIRESPITFLDRKLGESKLMNTQTMITSLVFPLRIRFNWW